MAAVHELAIHVDVCLSRGEIDENSNDTETHVERHLC